MFNIKIAAVLAICFALALPAWAGQGETKTNKPPDIMDIKEAAPSIALDMRYAYDHNFLGTRVDGYLAPRCLLTRKAAAALANVQKDLLALGHTIKVYDCYRPQRAVDHFVRWAEDISDIRAKKEFYPDLDKKDLFSKGFVARRSSHSRGSTVDLTIVQLPMPQQAKWDADGPQASCYAPAGKRFADNSIDMGTGFDCFSPLSHTANPKIGPAQRRNRLLLKTLMEKHGFENYEKEWWHYTLKDETYPDTYFDFPVK